MGYLSCKSGQSIATVDPHGDSPSPSRESRNLVRHKHRSEDPISIQDFSYNDLAMATGNFCETQLLGRGSHGLVYKGVLRGGRLVAIKRPSNSPSSQHPNETDNEIAILSQVRSPRLVNLLGFTKKGSHDSLLVFEFMCNGTLYDALHSSNSRPLAWGRRIKLALQTAMAIDTLHSLNPPVIHRDVKSANILIDENFNARLGDFGLALRYGDVDHRSTPPAGTLGYLDPCYVTPDNLSTKNDVFSFGILLLEIISGRKAIDMGKSPPCVVDWAVPLIKRGKLFSLYDPRIPPPVNATVRKMLAFVAAKCVRSCREKRPAMNEVVHCLVELKKLVPLHSWSGLANPCFVIDTAGEPVRSPVSRKHKNVNDTAED